MLFNQFIMITFEYYALEHRTRYQLHHQPRSYHPSPSVPHRKSLLHSVRWNSEGTSFVRLYRGMMMSDRPVVDDHRRTNRSSRLQSRSRTGVPHPHWTAGSAHRTSARRQRNSGIHQPPDTEQSTVRKHSHS